ncbi:MAG: synthase, epsilon subunit [Phycisphaerales bacterium]|nr:synthase, epsilon subunit [Phycisphaerales bacterium]
MSFQCTLVTPEQQVLDETVQQAIVPAHDGLIGILTGRAPLLIKLGTGELRIDLPGGQRRYFFVDGGVAQMKDNKLTILSTDAAPSAAISAETARAEYAEAEARRPTDAKTAKDREHQMARARAKRAIAGK